MSDVLPPAPSSGGGGCWKWGALSCGIGCGVLVLVTAVLLLIAWPRIKEGVSAASQAAQDIAAVKVQMDHVREALLRYDKEKGKYPDKLAALVPKYLAKADLHFSQDPKGPEFIYYKPRPNAEPTDVVLEYKLPVKSARGARVEMPVRMMMNGELATDFAPFPPASAPSAK